MDSQGARLRKLRLEKGLSLEEAQKKTKVHLSILKAIEEDSLVNLNPVYIKGFLKIYCKFLGVDPKDYITDYKEPQVVVKYVSDKEDRAGSFFGADSIKSIFFNTVYAKIKIFSIAILIIALFSIGVFYLGKFIFSRRASLPKKEKLSAIMLEKKVNPPKLQKQPAAVTIIRLGIRAKENCWIQLKADGRTVFENILKKGRFESWQAKEKIELSLGNARAVELEVNGKIIPVLGRRGQSLKNISITKEGLSVGR
jgi:cytoskeletal protein RodZ